MGSLTIDWAPDYLTKWGVPFRVHDTFGIVSRSSGGLDALLGFIDHHDALNQSTSFAAAMRAAMPPPHGNRSDGPVGQGCFDIDGVLHLWCAHAANTAGKGGPILGSRGVIALDNANRTTVNFEGRNDGVGSAWTSGQVRWKPRAYAAMIDGANHETPGAPMGPGDVWAHSNASRGWTNRKIDPAGPSPFGSVNRSGTWDMDLFRAAVLAEQIAGPGPSPEPAPPTLEESDMRPFLTRTNDGLPWLVAYDLSWRMLLTEQLVGAYAADGCITRPVDADLINAVPTTTLAGDWPFPWAGR